jgi:hypothetical protein
MKTPARSLLVAAFALAVGFAVSSAPRGDPGQCVDNFRAYDRVAARFWAGARGSPRRQPPDVERAAQRLIVQDCLTWTNDLDGMEAYAATLQGFRITDGPTAIRPTPVHLGALTSIADEVRVTIVFRGLGYNSRGVGAMELGRRIYIGPFYSQEALDQAIAIGLGAGFVAPYAAVNTRF